MLNFEPTKKDNVSFRISFIGDYQGVAPGLSTYLSVDAPTGVPQRASELDIYTLRDKITAAARVEPAVQKWTELRKQVQAAQAKVAESAKVAEKVRAAQLLAEDNPEPNFAEKLWQLESQLVSANAAAEAAKKDLETVRGLIPKHYANAANEVHDATFSNVTRWWLPLRDSQAAADKELDAACRRVEAIVVEAIREHINGPLLDCLAHRRANETHDRQQQFEDELRKQIVGDVPEGVTRGLHGRYEVKKPEVKNDATTDKSPQPQALQSQFVKLTTNR